MVASRMERYYSKQKKSRTNRNKDLYNNIYSYGKYSNIEGIASIDSANEIDITKVKEMIDNREKYQTERKYRRITDENKKIEEIPTIKKRYTEDNNRTYDIMDVLKEAKENKKPDNKERVLSKTSYDVLKNLDLKRKNQDYDEDLDNMIKTITNTSMISKLNNEDLAADMFSDLKGEKDDIKVSQVKDIKELIDDKTMDNSFFSSSIKLKKGDFVGYEKKSSTLKTIFVTILILGIITAISILVINRLGLF